MDQVCRWQGTYDRVCGLRVLICEQLSLTAPAGCLPFQERKAAERKQNPKKRGRKPKGTPASNKLTVSPS